jgi:cytochrome c oxidase subunit II
VKIPNSIITLLAGIVVTALSFWYGQNHGLLPEAATEEAPLVDGLFNTMMIISTGLFLIVQGALLIAIFRFRRRRGDNTDGSPIHGNIPLEILWTAIPTVIVLFIGIYSFEVYNSLGGLDPMAAHGEHVAHKMKNMRGAAIAGTLSNPNNPDETSNKVALGVGTSPEKGDLNPALDINVTGLQYAWIFNYPDAGVVSGELHVPVGREVKLNIGANDVIHAFWVPQFRLKQDAIPGRQTQLQFTPSKVGEYPVICAELCGAYHGAMKTRVIVQTPEEFDSWLQQNKVADNDMEKAVAVNPEAMTSDEFLAPYTAEMGVSAETLAQLHH